MTPMEANKLGLSMSAYLAYEMLGDGVIMTSIANELGLSTAAVTGIVDKLEAKNLVRRVRGKDRRSYTIEKI